MNMITEYIAAQIRQAFECAYCGRIEMLTVAFQKHYDGCESRRHYNREQKDLIDDTTKKMIIAREAFNNWRTVRDTMETAELSEERICTCMDPEEPCSASRVCVYKREAGPLLQKAKERFQEYVDSKRLTIEFRSSKNMRPLRLERFKLLIRRLRIDKTEEIDAIEEMKMLSEVDSELFPIEDTMRKSFFDVVRYEMCSEDGSFVHFMRVMDMLEAGDLEELKRADEDEINPDGSYDEDFEEELMRYDKVAIWINNGLLDLQRLVLKRGMRSVSCIEIFERAIRNVDYDLLMNACVLIRELLVISMQTLVRTMPIVFQLHELQNSNHFDGIYILGGSNGPDTIKKLEKLAIEAHTFGYEFRDKLRDKWMVKKKLLKTYKKTEWDDGNFRKFTLKIQEVFWNMIDVNLNHYRNHKFREMNAVIIANHYEELLAQACEPEAENVPESYNAELEELIEDGKINWYKRLHVNRVVEEVEDNRLSPVPITPSVPQSYQAEALIMEAERAMKELVDEKQREQRIAIMQMARNELQAQRNAKSKKPWANGTGAKGRNENRCPTTPGSMALYTELLEHALKQESMAQFRDLSDEQISKLIQQHELHEHAVFDIALQQMLLQEEQKSERAPLKEHQNGNDELVMQQGLQVYHDEILYDITDMDMDEDEEDEEEEGELREPETDSLVASEKTEIAPVPDRAAVSISQPVIDDITLQNETTTDLTENCGKVVRKRRRSLYEIENEGSDAKKRQEPECKNGHQSGVRSVETDDSTVSYFSLNDEPDMFLCSALDDKYVSREGLANEKYPRGRVDQDGFRIPPLPNRLIKSHKGLSSKRVASDVLLSESDFYVQDGNYVIKEEDGTLVTMVPTDTLYNPELDDELFTLEDIGNNEGREVENARSRFRRDHNIPDVFGIGEDENMFGTMDSFLALAGTSTEALKGVSEDIDMEFLSSLKK